MKMNPVVHFEMPAKNAKRVMKFYSSVFGWENKQYPDMGNYIVAMTTESDKKGPKKPGAINGGFYMATKSTNKYPSFVISVDDITKHIGIVKKAGGKIIGKPTDIPGVGKWVVFKDSEGNRVSMLQAKM
jgi:predicted enzyme related to lactoylglutathione lyase